MKQDRVTFGLRRRDVLKAAALGAAGAALGAPARLFAQEGAAQFALTPLAGDVSVATGAGCNVLVSVGADGLTLVDSGAQQHAEAFMSFLAQNTGQERIARLFSTHWHLDQTGGNEAAAARGAQIVSHINTQLWMSHSFHNWIMDREFAPRASAAVPTEIFHRTWSGGGLEAGYLPKSHTDGDIYVKFPEANVIASGDVGLADAWPFIDWSTGGWIGGLLDGIQVLIDVSDDETVIVPTSGPTVTRAELQAQHAMYTTILQRLAELMRQGYGFEEVLAARPTAEFDEGRGDPEQFVRLAYRSIWGHIRADRRVSTI